MERKLTMRCHCGEYVKDVEIGNTFICSKCGLKVMFIYNPKISTYEMEVINDARQHNNTTAA